ncbi:MAG: NAAT family transporter [Desulfobacterales bacterium]|nr:NAAT family transporter [Desulfobacterales bacterium]
MTVDSMDYAKAFIGVLAIVNPLGAIPVFISLTRAKSHLERKRTAGIAAVTVVIILIISAWAGELILGFFGVTIPALRVGGGLLILLMAIDMLHSRMSGVRHTEEEAGIAADKEDVAVVPLAIPLMSGPGAISLVIIDANQAAGGWIERLLFSACIVVVGVAVWLSLRLAEEIGRTIGVTGLNIATRIMGLLLAAIGVQFIAQGAGRLFPGLMG